MTVAGRGRALRALLALPLLAVPASARASGFAIESQGSRAMGFAGAYVAQAADPSAIFYNAGGVAFLKGKQLYVAGTFAGLSTDFTGEGPFPPAGTLEKSSRGLAVLPSLYYSQQAGDSMVVGLGVSPPFANRSEWQNPDEFTGRYICLECRIDSWSINPTIAFRLADRFAIGGGVDVRLASFKLSRRLVADPNPFPEPTDVAELTLDSGTDTGVGFNVGVLALPTENLSIGLAYRHEVKIDHAAQASFIQILTGNTVLDQAVAIALPASQPATVSFTYPGSIAAGVALRRGYWTIEADFQWMLWSSFDAVTISFLTSPAFDTVLPQAWESTWRGALGVEYLIRDDWEIRGGYGYDHSPAPTETISPFIHDADRHTFAAGGSWKYETLRLDFNLRYVLFRESSTLGLSRYDYDGSYKSNGLQLGVSLGYRF
jgi:long-chain fatty acid transport protein